MLGELQGRSGRVQKISPPSGFDLHIIHPVANCYTDRANPALQVGHISIWTDVTTIFILKYSEEQLHCLAEIAP
jgi:hypothetical protein